MKAEKAQLVIQGLKEAGVDFAAGVPDAQFIEVYKMLAEDRDIHRATAAEVFGVQLAEVTGDQRRAAKAINFGLIYGMSAYGLARQLGIPREAAQGYVDLYFRRYPGVKVIGTYCPPFKTFARPRLW